MNYFNKRKVLIISQPLGLNFGGILQAYSLQKTLQKIDYQVDFLDWNLCYTNIRYLLSIIKHLLIKIVYKKLVDIYPDFPPERLFNRIIKNTQCFIDTHIYLTKSKYRHSSDLSNYQELLGYDIYIAGSDQVWGCSSVNKYVKHCMFDFLENQTGVKRISYAASFGKDEFCSDIDFIQECKHLLKKFDAISVREDSGVKLCKELFDVDAVHVIDPTMFFDAEHYIKLSKERNDYFNDGDCFTYILDKTDEKQRIIDKVSRKFDLKPFNVIPKSKFADVGPKHIEDCVMPPVEQWLDGFNKAKFVVTDSFHGCVFSILFKKPFIAIGNASRGMARFESLLRMFKLENRLIHSETELTEQLLDSKIDYEAVHEILKKEREKAVKFLKDALGEER